jgi:uncharacterized protein YdeI (YjbR/CyaY-like superfamily)
LAFVIILSVVFMKLNSIYPSSRKEWNNWLKENYNKEKEIWVLFPKKASGKTRISYNDAVEEALSFGWIDSIVKRIDENFSAQRFTPRNPKSKYSQANIERLRRLVKEGKVISELLPSAKEVISNDFIFPKDILKEIEINPKAFGNFKKFSPSYQRIRVAFIDGARRRPEEFKKRLNYFIKMTEKNKMFGYGGIEKYY